MKKAREIHIPDDRPLTWDEFVDFRDHAYNSSSWYATEFSRTSEEILDKLERKGYPRGEVFYIDDEGNEAFFDIGEWVLEKLRDYYLIDDEALARRVVERELQNGRGSQWIITKLTQRGIERDFILDLLDELKTEDATIEAVSLIAHRYMNTSTYLKQPSEFKKKQKLVAHILSKGFSFNDISNWENSLEE